MNLMITLNAFGLFANMLGAIFLYIGTWALEPTPGPALNDLGQVADTSLLIEMQTQAMRPEQARARRDAVFQEVFFGASRRNQRRVVLNRLGLGSLILGFALQLAALMF